MTLSSYISDYLRQHNKVDIMGFGTFVLVKSRAILDADTQTLLPPSQQVNFHLDYDAPDTGLINFIAHSDDVSLQHVKRDLDVQIEYWKKKIVAKEEFNIEGLGKFTFQSGQLAFEGIRLDEENPDFYGLESISLTTVEPETKETSLEDLNSENQKKSRWIFWLFLIIIPVLGIIYVVYEQQDLLFGSKTTKDISVQTATHRIPDTSVDTINVVKDTLKIDSLQHQDSMNTSESIIPKNIQ